VACGKARGKGRRCCSHGINKKILPMTAGGANGGFLYEHVWVCVCFCVCNRAFSVLFIFCVYSVHNNNTNNNNKKKEYFCHF